MRLSELTTLIRNTDLGEPGAPRRPPRDNLRYLQDVVSQGLLDSDFTLDCIEHDVTTWREWEQSGWRRMKPPLTQIPELGVSIRMCFWSPGMVAMPHEHTSWTVSAVFHNRLRVTTFHWDRAVAERRLETKNSFSAEAGRVGYIYDNCIHSPSNTTNAWSTSLHIFNADDRPILERQVGRIEGLETYDDAAVDSPGRPEPQRDPKVLLAVRENVFRCHIRSAVAIPSARTLTVLAGIYRDGDRTTRALITRAMRRLDPQGARSRLRKL